MTAATPLLTRCTKCREEIVIARKAAIVGATLQCHHCGTPAYLWQLVGQLDRDNAPVVEDYAPQFPRKPFADSPGWEAA